MRIRETCPYTSNPVRYTKVRVSPGVVIYPRGVATGSDWTKAVRASSKESK